MLLRITLFSQMSQFAVLRVYNYLFRENYLLPIPRDHFRCRGHAFRGVGIISCTLQNKVHPRRIETLRLEFAKTPPSHRTAKPAVTEFAAHATVKYFRRP